ncbi:hypothetical protein [Dyadobacter sp. LHD-138]|uniref:hypothetical protein n=1 Tax=Dyadobacter sp. LHD-138 TaxID=3071413 RepID=UPI0027E1CA9B|nr:hypothetical protein [Dyadobacter sp. LHD-138]MDQ6481607.1 hypothetical protein [Dyadobacter sp. LHD-138]
MNQPRPNPVLGTFVIEEHDGKKYKMMFVEEIAEEPNIEIIEKTCQDLEGV